MKQLNKGQAISFAKSGAWKSLSYEERAKLQFQQKLLCMPFSVYHEAMEKTLGRPVYSHEFALNVEGIRSELYFDGEPPTLEEIMNQIPAEKRMVVLT